MDPIGVFIANLHNLVGHDTAAAVIGVSWGDKADCVLCRYESDPTPDARQLVIGTIGQAAGRDSVTVG